MKPELRATCNVVDDPPENGWRMCHSGTDRHYFFAVEDQEWEITEDEFDLWMERLGHAT